MLVGTRIGDFHTNGDDVDDDSIIKLRRLRGHIIDPTNIWTSASNFTQSSSSAAIEGVHRKRGC